MDSTINDEILIVDLTDYEDIYIKLHKKSELIKILDNKRLFNTIMSIQYEDEYWGNEKMYRELYEKGELSIDLDKLLKTRKSEFFIIEKPLMYNGLSIKNIDVVTELLSGRQNGENIGIGRTSD
jgi:hypothetical protein